MAEYMIWSNEHGAWWRPNERGYTTLLHEAGSYTFEEMRKIVDKANVAIGLGYPNEVALCISGVAQ
jgi:hypothetical protein